MSVTIMRRMMVHPRVKNCSTIMMYYSLDDEVDTHDTIDQLVKAGKKVLLPAVISDTEMDLRCYEGPKDLVGGFFHIMEPIGKTFTDYSQIEVAIVPGIAVVVNVLAFFLIGDGLNRVIAPKMNANK